MSAQDCLDYLGLTTLLAKILMAVHMGEEGSVADIAVQLFIELLVGGNLRVQETLFRCVRTAYNFAVGKTLKSFETSCCSNHAGTSRNTTPPPDFYSISYRGSIWTMLA